MLENLLDKKTYYMTFKRLGIHDDVNMGGPNLYYNSKRTDHDLMCGSYRYLIAVTVHQ